jgi:hypothetical protein
VKYSYECHNVHHFFQTGVVDGELLPEDYYFCELALRAGHPTFVDTAIRLRHVGRAGRLLESVLHNFLNVPLPTVET